MIKIVFLPKNFFRRVTFVLCALVGQPFFAFGAIEKTNAFEMVTALTTMALDIAHKHYQFKNDINKTEVLGLLAATSSVTNKSLFLLNNHHAQIGLSPWDGMSRDCIVNGVWGARDLVTIAENLALISTRSMDMDADNNPEQLASSESFANTQKEHPTHSGAAKLSKKSKPFEYAYARDVIIFPILKGLSSLAVACTQNYTTSYSDDRARFTATAAYSFIRLLEEYCSLSTDSKLSKPLIAAALVNLLWLGYEAQEYINEEIDVHGKFRQGVCAQCDNRLQRKLRVLACGHARCTNCLNHTIEFQKNHHPGQLHRTICQEAGCDHRFTRNEIRGIVKNNPQIMRAYDIAAFNNNPAFVPPAPGPVPPAPQPVRPPRPPFAPIDDAVRDAFNAQARQGNCAICMEDEADLRVLGCNHAYCLGCLQGHINAHAGGGDDDDGGAIDQLRCMEPACERHISRDEIGCIVAADQQRRILDLYDDTAYNRAHPEQRPADEAELAEIAAGHLQICPRCNQRIHRVDGCNHITCPCGEHFCWLCGGICPAGNPYGHFRPDGCPVWGPRRGAPAPAPVDDDDDEFVPFNGGIRPAPPYIPRGPIRIDLGHGNVFEMDLERDFPELFE